jgi:hypothetical protein
MSPQLMDGTYFVGRNELLQWINSTLGLNLQKIEQVHILPAYCFQSRQAHPGQAPWTLHSCNPTSVHVRSRHPMCQPSWIVLTSHVKLSR